MGIAKRSFSAVGHELGASPHVDEAAGRELQLTPCGPEEEPGDAR